MTQQLEVETGSHDYKALVHALSVLPHDLVIGFSDEDITRVATAMMSLGDRPRPRATLVTAPLGRHLFGFVWLPRDLLSTTVREQIEALAGTRNRRGDARLEPLGRRRQSGAAALRDGFPRAPSKRPTTRPSMPGLQDMLRGWGDAVEEALAQAGEGGRSAALAARYAASFPAFYRTTYGAGEAAADILRLRQLAAQGEDCGSWPRCAAVRRGQRWRRPAAAEDLPAPRRAAAVRCGARAGEFRLPGVVRSAQRT